MIDLIIILNIIIFSYFIALCFFYTVLLLFSFPIVYRQFQEIKYGNVDRFTNAKFSMPVTVIMPAYNITDDVINAIHSILNSDYKYVQIIVVNDGSTDDTLSKLISTFSMFRRPLIMESKIKTAPVHGYYVSHSHPKLIVLDKEHSNTGDSLNAGINACSTPVFITIDADTMVEKATITRLMFAFLTEADCVAMGGAVCILNGNEVKKGVFSDAPRIPDTLIPAMQVCEYFRSFLFFRAGWNVLGGALSYSGALTLFDKEAVLLINGYEQNNFAQDAEIIVRLHSFMLEAKSAYSIGFAPLAFSWTRVPENLGTFWTQRDHWQRGLMRSFWLYRHMMFNPKYGMVGMFSYPFYIIFEIISPLVEGCAYLLLFIGWYLGIISKDAILLFFGLAVGCASVLTMATVLMDSLTFNKYPRFLDALKILLLSFADMIIFRQYHTVCKCVATVRYLIHRSKGERL